MPASSWRTRLKRIALNSATRGGLKSEEKSLRTAAIATQVIHALCCVLQFTPDAQIFPLIHKWEMLVRSSNLPASMTTAGADKLRARSFSSRLRYRRIESKSSTMLSDLFTALAPIRLPSSSSGDLCIGEPGL